MRILYLNPVGALGGAERCLLDMMAAVQRAIPAAELHLIVMADGPLVEMARAAGVRVVLLPMPNSMTFVGDSQLSDRTGFGKQWGFASHCMAAGLACSRYVLRLRREIKRLSPDLIHSNGIKSHLLLFLTQLHRAPIVWHLHDFCGARRLVSKCLRRASGRVASAIAVSDAAARDAERIMPKVALHAIHNTVDIDRFCPGHKQGSFLDELAGMPATDEEVVRVGLVATYGRWKGQDIFLQAAAKVIAAHPQTNLRFYVVGGPIYQTRGSQFTLQELRAQLRPLRITGRVGFIGFQHNTVDVYRALDILVHASTRPEPFGLTIAEAMACGKPVVVSRAGGAAELFTDGHDAIGVPPGDPSALAAAINRLLENVPLQRRLGNRARQTAVTRFSQQRLGPQLVAVYEKIARGSLCPTRACRAA